MCIFHEYVIVDKFYNRRIDRGIFETQNNYIVELYHVYQCVECCKYKKKIVYRFSSRNKKEADDACCKLERLGIKTALEFLAEDGCNITCIDN